MLASLRTLAGQPRRFKMLRRPKESIRPAMPRPERRDSHGRLCAALLQIAGDDALTEGGTTRPWHSATFVGTQHHLTLTLTGDDVAERAKRLAETLPEVEFRIAGHVVADLAVDHVSIDDDGQVSLQLCILTIEDW